MRHTDFGLMVFSFQAVTLTLDPSLTRVISLVLFLDAVSFVVVDALDVLRQHAPQLAQLDGDLRVRQLRHLLCQVGSAMSRPHHEGVHWSLDVHVVAVGDVDWLFEGQSAGVGQRQWLGHR